MIGQDGDGVPDAGLNIDANCIAAQDEGAVDLSGVVECEKCQLALEHQERLGLWRIAVPMGSDVGALYHHIEESTGVLFDAGVEIVICPQAGRLARTLNEGEKKRGVDYL